MDFSSLPDSDLIQFLRAANIRPQTSRADLIRQAQDLYLEMASNRNVQYPEAVADLYLAEQAKLNLGYPFDAETLQYFRDYYAKSKVGLARLLNLSEQARNFEQRLDRILNIMDPSILNPLISKAEPTELEFRALKALTFNVCFQCMLGIKTGTVKLACPPSEPGGPTKCLIKVANYIQENGPYDIVALQESTNVEQIVERSEFLQQMAQVDYQPGDETMTTFYNKNLKLDAGVSIIRSYLENKGRPLMAIFFEGFCVMNLHPGHRNRSGTPDFDKLDSHIQAFLDNKKPGSNFLNQGFWQTLLAEDEVEQIKNKLRSYPIILMGDMNRSFDNVNPMNLKISGSDQKGSSQKGRDFVGFNTIPTCCDSHLNTVQKGKNYDQILCTTPGYVTNHKVPVQLKMASDHLPLIAEVFIPEN